MFQETTRNPWNLKVPSGYVWVTHLKKLKSTKTAPKSFVQLCSNKPLAKQLQNLLKSAENTGFAVQQSCHLWNERERARALLGSNSFFPFSSLPHSNCALHCIALCIAVHCWGVSVVEALPVINIIPALSLFPPPASYWLHSCSLHSCCSYWLLTSPCHSTALKWKCHEHQLVHCCPDCCNVRTAPRCTIIPLHCSLSTIK